MGFFLSFIQLEKVGLIDMKLAHYRNNFFNIFTAVKMLKTVENWKHRVGNVWKQIIPIFSPKFVPFLSKKSNSHARFYFSSVDSSILNDFFLFHVTFLGFLTKKAPFSRFKTFSRCWMGFSTVENQIHRRGFDFQLIYVAFLSEL